MESPKIERVIYWAIRFRLLRSMTELKKRQMIDLFMGKSEDKPTGILKESIEF